MPVLHTSPLATPGEGDAGGLNVVVTNVALALGRAGHRVDLVTRRSAPDQPATADVAEGVRVFYLPAGPARAVAKSAAEALIAPFASQFTGWLADHPVDIVHAHHWFAAVAALSATHAAGLPHAVSFHSLAARPGTGLAGGEPPESPGRAAGEARAAAESDLIITVSGVEERLIRDTYTVREPVRVAQPGVDTHQFRPAAEARPAWLVSLTDGRPYVFFAARLQPLKAPDLLLRAMATLPADRRPVTVIAGAASPDFAGYEGELRELVAALGLERDVRFIGSLSREDLAAALRHALLLATPSFSETFGIINLEASASSIPVVAWRASGMRESVRDGVTGTLIDTREPKDWGAAIVRYATDPALRADHGGAGRRWALTRTWSTTAAEYLAAYREVL